MISLNVKLKTQFSLNNVSQLHLNTPAPCNYQNNYYFKRKPCRIFCKSIRKYIHSRSQIKQSKLLKTIRAERKPLISYWTKSLDVLYEFHEYLDDKSRSRWLKKLTFNQPLHKITESQKKRSRHRLLKLSLREEKLTPKRLSNY